MSYLLHFYLFLFFITCSRCSHNSPCVLGPENPAVNRTALQKRGLCSNIPLNTIATAPVVVVSPPKITSTATPNLKALSPRANDDNTSVPNVVQIPDVSDNQLILLIAVLTIVCIGIICCALIGLLCFASRKKKREKIKTTEKYDAGDDDSGMQHALQIQGTPVDYWSGVEEDGTPAVHTSKTFPQTNVTNITYPECPKYIAPFVDNLNLLCSAAHTEDG